MTKKIALIISGCGHLDGGEIREAVFSLLEIDRNGGEAHCFAPNIKQHEVVNHIDGKQSTGQRNVLQEAARIARGKIKDMDFLQASDFDALVIPGGYGVAKNLSDLAFKGIDATVNPEFARIVQEFAAAKKPIAALCIAPAVVAVILGKDYAPTLTIGDDEGTAFVIESFGGKHMNCAADEYIYDEKNRIISTPAYMHEARISDIHRGIAGAIAKLFEI